MDMRDIRVGQRVTMTREGDEIFRVVGVWPERQCVEAVSERDGSARRAHPVNFAPCIDEQP